MGYFDWFWNYFGDSDTNAMIAASTPEEIRAAAQNLAAKDEENGCTSSAYRDKGMERPCCLCNTPSKKCWRVDGAYSSNPIATEQHNDAGEQTIGCCAPDNNMFDPAEYVCADSAETAEEMFRVTEVTDGSDSSENTISGSTFELYGAEYIGTSVHRDPNTITDNKF